MLAMERDMLGMYVSGHPLGHVRDRLAQRVTATMSQLAELHDRSEVVVGGLVSALKRTTTKSGAAMAFLTLEDLTGSGEVIVFPKTYEQANLALRRDAIIVVRGRLDVADQQVKILADAVIPLDETAAAPVATAAAPAAQGPRGRRVEPDGSDGDAHGAGGPAVPLPAAGGLPGASEASLHVHLDAERHGEEGLRRLKELLGRHPGDRPVVLTVRAGGREVRMQAGDLRVASSRRIVEEIESLLGPRSAVWMPPRDG
jgi:DNA polymerase-3 subunit alpha